MSVSKICPKSEKATKGTGGSAHYWSLSGPFRQVATGSRVSTALRGRFCVHCKEEDPEFVICAEVVMSHERWTRWSRCERAGTLRSHTAPSHAEKGIVEIDEEGYAFCKTHHPETVRARRAAAPLTQWERDSIAMQRKSDLIQAVKQWDTDEAATEGFTCEGDCEHHECKLHRVLLRYLEPIPTHRVPKEA